MTTPVSELFREEPFRWGYRGDPYLWREMRERLSAVAGPATEAELRAVVEAEFRELTGFPVSHGEPMYIEKYSQGWDVQRLRFACVVA